MYEGGILIVFGVNHEKELLLPEFDIISQF
jgi:hypothetical protein